MTFGMIRFYSVLAGFALLNAWSATSVSPSNAQEIRRETKTRTDVKPLPQAHAHNDYLHANPLHDALRHGFCSVEADVFLVDGELLVAHTWLGLKRDRTLKKLYLDPLSDRVKKMGGRVYRNGPVFTLLVDIKKDGANAYRALSKQVASYEDVFSSVEDGKFVERAVNVIISGDRAIDVIKAESPRWAGIDGRLGDLRSDAPAHEMPLISDHWGRNFDWPGYGPMSKADHTKLKDVVRTAHDQGRRVRFWAIPDRPSTWKVLRDEGVDLINTDRLEELSGFLRDE